MPSEYFGKVKALLLDLDYAITHEDEGQELFIVNDEDSGINNLIVDCEDPLLVLEQIILPIPQEPGNSIPAFAANEPAPGAWRLWCWTRRRRPFFFVTRYRIENLDSNELEGSIEALSLALAEMRENSSPIPRTNQSGGILWQVFFNAYSKLDNPKPTPFLTIWKTLSV